MIVKIGRVELTEEEAQRSLKYLQFVFGKQISWMGIRKRSFINE